MSAVVITGASGFLGRHLLAHYRDSGRDVIAITHDQKVIDIPPSSTVIHCAALRNAPRADITGFGAANVTFAEIVARMAMRSGVRRFIHLGTAIVLGSSAVPLDDNAPLADPNDPYIRSKIDGILALERLAAEGLPLVTILPSVIYGPVHPGSRNRATAHMRRVLAKPIRIGVDAPPRNVVFVDDVVSAIVRAEEQGQHAARYLIAGENVTPDAFERAVFTAAGRRPTPRMVVPRAIVTASARAMDALLGYDVAGGWTARVRTLFAPWCFRPVRAIAELNLIPTPLAEGVRRTIATFG